MVQETLPFSEPDERAITRLTSTLGSLKPVDAVGGANPDGLAYLDAVLAEIKAIDREDAGITAHNQKQIERLDDLYTWSAQTFVDGQKVAFDERRKQLVEFAGAFCTLYREELLPADEKSFKLKSGATVGFRKQPAKIDSDQPPKATVALIKQACSTLMQKLRVVLASVSVTGRNRKADLFLKVDVTLDKDGIKRAYEDERLRDENLEAFGLRYVEGEDKFFCKP